MSDSKKIEGDFAFPGIIGPPREFTNGMSLRAYIATKVISGLCANPSIFQANSYSGWDLVNCTERQLSDCAVRIADEMIASLEAGAS
ncbi:hypothetical protein [Rhizobium lentis]|uniref:Uncharacterized protein n=1 Tax=Rhizobium lentis TaxID=1138194 RepID=A0ABS7IIZ9_9HYPH|nr:hypothetical protein [Rhizobium lentis]MBX5089384.1 hypothetical protein [Rhizobium lentis]